MHIDQTIPYLHCIWGKILFWGALHEVTKVVPQSLFVHFYPAQIIIQIDGIYYDLSKDTAHKFSFYGDTDI